MGYCGVFSNRQQVVGLILTLIVIAAFFPGIFEDRCC
ncbi:hypothetical protein EDD73_105146 [Heliophilum fasciatum]|uniref:Uncharacterized protein n=1 Tax=Heliophilum fasciatum TaxID=35700 RepID=A0A4R2RV76_9FIRM|nr:hypothetical protein [Heliophilum fasciatum]TCP67248.1 hypothetical protein EDD73_105146 [Heliophilum fasciatum]